MKFFIRTLALCLCAVCLTVCASAAEVASGSVYCFGSGDFSQGDIHGICLTGVPSPSVGTVSLNGRTLHAGDVVPGELVSQMTFCPVSTAVSKSAEVRYYAIGEDGMEPEQVMTISIHGRENQPPVAEDSASETYKNLETTGRLKVHDPENKPMTYTLSRPPKRGTVTISEDGSFTYTPKKNKIGIDSFTFTAADEEGKTSREATVTITILKPSAEETYTDTAGKDCCFAAEWMKNTGIFAAERVGGLACFSPEKAVTQGEFLTMLVKTLDIPVEEELAVSGYEDAPGWLKPYLAAAVRSGLARGMETMAYDEPMDSDSAVSLVCSALNLEDLSDIPVFSEAQIPSTLTRGDTAKLLYQVHQIAQEAAKPKAWQ